MSMKPGATTNPRASTVRAALAAARSPISAILSPRIPTSTRRAGAPEPSNTSPPRITRSNPAWAPDNATHRAPMTKAAAALVYGFMRHLVFDCRLSTADLLIPSHGFHVQVVHDERVDVSRRLDELLCTARTVA